MPMPASSARGDFDARSDIDLIGLVEARNVAAKVRSEFVRRPTQSGRRVQLRLLDEVRLARMFTHRSSFAIHVLREGRIVYDPTGRFTATAAPHSREAPVRDNRPDLLRRLEAYEDLAWCQGLYLYMLSDLYSVGRAAAITILGRQSRFEFSGMRALQAVGSEQPRLAAATEQIGALRPFFLLAVRDEESELPFPYQGSHDEAHEARAACHALVEAIH